MKQKITSAVLATAVLVSVTGCQKSPKSPNNAPPSTTPNLDWLINYEPPAGTTTETKATTTATTNAPPTLAATTTVVTNAEVEAVAEEPPIVFLGDPVLPADSASARNLPVIRLSTATGKQVTSRTEYIGGTFAIEPRLSDTDNTNNGWYLPFEQTNIKVRGRGNTSWTNTAKKSYRIKFGSDVSPFGLPAANSWVLIANYNDPSFVRDKVAYAMERVLDFDFVPTAILVDLYLNDDYIGVYNFGDVIEVEDGRLEMYTSYYGAVASGYLLEIGGAEKGDIKNVDYFDTKLLKDIAVKAPDSDDVLSEEQLNYIKSYVAAAEKAVIDWTNWEDYIDLDSFVDWFLSVEMVYNSDGTMTRSCFMSKELDGKLRMQSVWDNDYALGNYYLDGSYKDWATVHDDTKSDSYRRPTWINYLIKDKRFKAAVKARWEEKGKAMLNAALSEIETQRVLVGKSAADNSKIWNTRPQNKYGTTYSRAWATVQTYGGQLDFIAKWLKARYKTIGEKIKPW